MQVKAGDEFKVVVGNRKGIIMKMLIIKQGKHHGFSDDINKVPIIGDSAGAGAWLLIIFKCVQ